ncbi:MAG: hypothetical protein HeimC3_17080 [Candidatus Heimdallarchaeota archaeon LC_3]|nr:MAG: hypothetical protein HeimC3_17080 [Candidatus Heimdallarchaeota archaeon LC_3]
MNKIIKWRVILNEIDLELIYLDRLLYSNVDMPTNEIDKYFKNIDDLSQKIQLVLSEISHEIPLNTLLNYIQRLLYNQYYKNDYNIKHYIPSILLYHAFGKSEKIKELSSDSDKDFSLLVFKAADMAARTFEYMKINEIDLSRSRLLYLEYMLNMTFLTQKLGPFQRKDISYTQISIGQKILKDKIILLQKIFKELEPFNNKNEFFQGISPKESNILSNLLLSEKENFCKVSGSDQEVKRKVIKIQDNLKNSFFLKISQNPSFDEQFPNFFNTAISIEKSKVTLFDFLSKFDTGSAYKINDNFFFSSCVHLNKYFDELEGKIVNLPNLSELNNLNKTISKKIKKMSHQYTELHEKGMCDHLNASKVFGNDSFIIKDIKKGSHEGWNSTRQIDYLVVFPDPTSEKWFIGIGDIKFHSRKKTATIHFIKDYQIFLDELIKQLNASEKDIKGNFDLFIKFLEKNIDTKVVRKIRDSKENLIFKFATIFPETLHYHFDFNLIYINEWTTKERFQIDLKLLVDKDFINKLPINKFSLIGFFFNTWEIVYSSNDPLNIINYFNQFDDNFRSELTRNELVKVIFRSKS